MSTESVPIIF